MGSAKIFILVLSIGCLLLHGFYDAQGTAEIDYHKLKVPV